jgi:hypothetical protein
MFQLQESDSCLSHQTQLLFFFFFRAGSLALLCVRVSLSHETQLARTAKDARKHNTFLPIRTRNGYFLHGYETVVSLPVFMFWRNFAKFRPEKYDFDLYKGFFMEKKRPKIAKFPRKK